MRVNPVPKRPNQRELWTLKLSAWCRRHRITADFELRKVRDLDVVFVILRGRGDGL
jgi:hypothetical protein